MIETDTFIDQDVATETLLTHLWRGGAFAFYWTPDGRTYTRDGKEYQAKHSHWISTEKIRPYPSGWNTKNVYFGVNPTFTKQFDPDREPNTQRSSVATIAAINCFFADFDGKAFVTEAELTPALPVDFVDLDLKAQKEAHDAAQLQTFLADADHYLQLARQAIAAMPVPPSVIVNSGGGYHAYHLLTDTVIVTDANRWELDTIQWAWVKLVGGDMSAKDIARVLRLPGSQNRKKHFVPDFPLVTFEFADFERLYDFSVFENLTAAIRAERVCHQGDTGHRNGVVHSDEYENVADALRRLATWRADDRSEWIRIGLAIKAGLGDSGFDLWRAWSQGSHKYEEDVCVTQWKAMRPTNISIATLFGMAQTDNPKPKQAEVEQYTYGFVVETPEPLDLIALTEATATASTARHNTWPYANYQGRIVFCKESEDDILRYPVADFVASIDTEYQDENDARAYLIVGSALRGGAFQCETPARLFGEPAKLRAILEEAAGALNPVHRGMSEHLPSAIKLLTDADKLTTLRRFKRTGWMQGAFLMPGMVGAGTHIELLDKLPYRINFDADFVTGAQALTDLIECIKPSIATPLLAMLLQAPLHRPAGWQNERYGFFVQGRTGSLKTSWAQTCMCIYGAGFANEASLIKWGEGSTRNAIMAYATSAHDMPFLIDNYKPNTGGGEHDFVNLIHNILEGGEKDRLNRASQLREARPIHCFPLITGEDIPDHDPASLARLLITGFEWQSGQPNDRLAQAQVAAEHLNAIGSAWLQWLLTPEAQVNIKRIGATLNDVRNRWSAHLRSLRPDMVNILRVGTNLATNELTWQIALTHPRIGPLLNPHTAAHSEGLQRIAHNMSLRTAEALEAQRFLGALRELLATRQLLLLPSQVADPEHTDPKRLLGWFDDAGCYILPTIAIERVRQLLGPGNFTISPQALYTQLDGIKAIARKGEDFTTRQKKINGTNQRVLHLKPEALNTPDADDEDTSLLRETGL